jgi:hypothetical protein
MSTQPQVLSDAATAPMFDPQGAVRMVPNSLIPDAVKAGGKYAVQMLDPQGVKRYVPHDVVSQAQQAGGQVHPDEPRLQHPGGLSTWFSDLKEFLTPTAQNPYPGMEQEAKSAAAQHAQEADVAREKAGYSKAYRAVVPVAESIGTNVEGMEQSAKEGDVSGVVGHVAAPVTAMGTTMAGVKALGGKLSRPNPPAVEVAPHQVEALATMIDDRGGAVDPHAVATEALPALRNQAALDKLDTSVSGRELGHQVLKTANNAIDAHMDQVSEITQPYKGVAVDTTPIAQAYLDRVTPELLRDEPKTARALQREAGKFAQISPEGTVIGPKPMTLDDVNAYRIRLNNETRAAQSKGEGAFRKTDWETQADVAAVAAARDVQYGNLAKLSGLPEEHIRSLQRTEGQLMEVRDSLAKQVNQVSGQQAEAAAGSFRANPPGSGRFVSTVREKIGHTYPSRHGVERTLLRETVAPDPIDVFNNRLRLAVGDVGEETPRTGYEQVQPPQPPATGGTLSQRVASQPLPKLKPVEPPSRIPSSGARSRLEGLAGGGRAQGLTGAEKAARTAAVMMALKNGEITQGEADRQIQRLNGGGGRKLTPMRRPDWQ